MTSRHCSKVLSITGFMGCGKTTVGRILAQFCGSPFIDLDSEIEKRTGTSISEIFSRIGEYGFRAVERMTLESVLTELTANGQQRAVLSLGGGTLTTPECAMLVKRYTKCVWLKASPETILENLSGDTERPLLCGCADETSRRKRICCLLEERSPIYKATAALEVETDGKSPNEIASEILENIDNIRFLDL